MQLNHLRGADVARIFYNHSAITAVLQLRIRAGRTQVPCLRGYPSAITAGEYLRRDILRHHFLLTLAVRLNGGPQGKQVSL